MEVVVLKPLTAEDLCVKIMSLSEYWGRRKLHTPEIPTLWRLRQED